MASMNPVNIKAGLIKVKESQHGLGDAAADTLHMRNLQWLCRTNSSVFALTSPDQRNFPPAPPSTGMNLWLL